MHALLDLLCLFQERLDIEAEIIHFIEHFDGCRGGARIRGVDRLTKEAKRGMPRILHPVRILDAIPEMLPIGSTSV